jgi:L-cysteate sulfo-lyase
MQKFGFSVGREFPFRTLLEGPTPIQKLERLSEREGVKLFVKRDDLTGLGMGGNKLRKLEFLIGDALSQGADTVVTVGAWQSNHARLTAAVAAKLGLRCELVLNHAVARADEDYEHNGNALLNGLLGAVVHDLPGAADTLAFAQERAAQLRSQGRRVYVCPLGGSSPLGCLGYTKAALEIAAQEQALGFAFDEIVIPNGSGGMHAGLVAGMKLLGRTPSTIRAHAVLSGLDRSREITTLKLEEVLELIGLESSIDARDLNLSGAQLGAGYGVATDPMEAAVRTLASTEGLVVDPVYGGKALAGLLADVRSGRYQREQNVLFLMTGGLPGLFAYRRAFST